MEILGEVLVLRICGLREFKDGREEMVKENWGFRLGVQIRPWETKVTGNETKEGSHVEPIILEGWQE